VGVTAGYAAQRSKDGEPPKMSVGEGVKIGVLVFGLLRSVPTCKRACPMTTLSQFQCVPCRGGEPTLTGDEIARLSPEAPDWAVVEREGILRLERLFKFKNFVQALEFTNRVGGIAEEQGHHPAILTGWGKVTVTWVDPQDQRITP
jgi:4a-hydroxytetrahydrobiopterin dehydratase